MTLILDSKLVTLALDPRHRPRCRERKNDTLLYLPQENPTSLLASRDIGGVLISPWRIRSAFVTKVLYQIRYHETGAKRHKSFCRGARGP